MQTPTELFVHVASVERRVEILDDGGCPTWFYTAVAGLQEVACRINPGDDPEIVMNAVERSLTTHVMFCGDVDIRPTDQVTYDGTEFDVIAVHQPDDLGVFTRILLAEII